MKGKKFREGIGIGAVAAAISLVLWMTGALDRWEFNTWAWRVEFFAKPGIATDKIKLILLDQASLTWGEKENGWSWPWPREVYGPIIDYCKRSGARAVIFDVLFTESSVYGVQDDHALGAAIERGPPFVGAVSLGTSSAEATAWPTDIPRRSPVFMANMEDWLATPAGKKSIVPFAAFPIPEVGANATVLANVIDEPDIDGIFRRVSPFRVFDGRIVPSMGLAGFVVGQKASHPAVEGQEGLVQEMRFKNGYLLVGGKAVPLDKAGKMTLRFRGPSGTYESASAAEVIQSELRFREGKEPTLKNPDFFKNSYVFFGFSAPGLLDLRPTPISKVFAGVEIHATMLDNLLSNDSMHDTSVAAVVLTTLLLSFGSGLLVTSSRTVRHSLVAFAVFLPLPVVIGLLSYALGFWWPIVVHGNAVTLSLVGGLVLNYATEGRQKAFIKKAFRYYLSPAVIERILEDPSKLQLGGERRELTIFFSDLESFSSISERLDPHSLTSLLNDYLSDMTDIILEEGGTLDKYEGDAIIAFWNAPLTQEDHALRACRTAIRCQRKLQERQEEFARRAGRPLRMRIGMNTGEVVVGNMGSHTRFDYTVLGDAANLAARLEGANKAFNTYTMVSEATWQQTSGQIVGREMGLLTVVGRKTPVRVFELIGFPGETDTPETEAFHRGLSCCYAGEWTEALAILEGLSKDPVAKVYAQRCRTLIGTPGASWDGIWNLQEK